MQMINTKSVEIVLKYMSKHPIVYTDAQRYQQVLLNLLKSAINDA